MTDELRIAELKDALDHIRAVCECPGVMSFTIDLEYVARVARHALRDAKPWQDRATRRVVGDTVSFQDSKPLRPLADETPERKRT